MSCVRIRLFDERKGLLLTGIAVLCRFYVALHLFLVKKRTGLFAYLIGAFSQESNVCLALFLECSSVR